MGRLYSPKAFKGGRSSLSAEVYSTLYAGFPLCGLLPHAHNNSQSPETHCMYVKHRGFIFNLQTRWH